MKKLLLLSSAMLMSATVAVIAGNGDRVLQSVNTQKKVLTKASTMQNQVMKQNGHATIAGHAYTASTLPVRAAATGSNISYQLPVGYFYMGASLEDTGAYLNGGIIQGPAYQKTTWKNTSKAGDSFVWTYRELDGKVTTSEVKDLITPEYPLTLVDAPELKAQVNGQSESFSEGIGIMQTGGILAFENSSLGLEDGTYGAARFKITKADKRSYGDVYHYNDKDADAFWQQQKLGSINSFTVIYDAPASPYSLSAAWTDVVIDKAGVNTDRYILNIRKVTMKDNTYSIGEVLASGTCTVKDLIVLGESQDGTIGTLYFGFEEEEGGLVSDVDLTVDHAIAVELTADKENKGGITPRGFFSPTQNLDSKSYLGFTSGKYFPAGGIGYGSADNSVYCNDFVFSLGITYTYLFSVDGKYNFEAATAGESKTFNMNTYYTGDYWEIEGEGIDDWIQYSYGSFDPQVGEVGLTFAVSELPAGIQGRSSEVTVSMPGASQKFTITQGVVTGIANTEMTTVKAICDGENIQLTYSEGINSVAILNVAGQTLATYELPVSGNYEIPVAGLSQGMYILKFNNNQTVKVAK